MQNKMIQLMIIPIIGVAITLLLLIASMLFENNEKIYQITIKAILIILSLVLVSVCIIIAFLISSQL